MTKEEIAQWVIDNRFAKSETEKTSDFEMYHFLTAQIGIIESENERLKSELLGNTEQLKAEREWISVEDRLPMIINGFFNCLVFRNDKEIRQARFNVKTQRFQNMNFENIHEEVTLWMPLPQPPKQ